MINEQIALKKNGFKIKWPELHVLAILLYEPFV
jgi:hypothetical protein